jgi:hypothetical protein
MLMPNFSLEELVSQVTHRTIRTHMINGSHQSRVNE